MNRRTVITLAIIVTTLIVAIPSVTAYLKWCNPVIEAPTVSRLLTLVNEERARYGVAPLILDERLNQSAQMKAADMDTNHYFGHEGLDGKQGGTYVMDVAPGLCREIGENITDNIHVNDANSAMYAWIHSPPHHAGMVDRTFTLTGFGISGTKIVEHFCYPR